MLVVATAATRSCEGEYPCRGQEVEWEWVSKGGWVSPDNRLHFTVRVNPDVPYHVRGAVALAVKGWNEHLENIILDMPAADDWTRPTDLWIVKVDNEALDGNCAKFHSGRLPHERKIASGPQAICYSKMHYESWITSTMAYYDAAVVMAHEIGHFLGLDDADISAVGTIMAQGHTSCRYYAVNARTRLPTREDARNAGVCVANHRLRQPPMTTPTKVQAGLTTGLIFSVLSLSFTPSIIAQEPIGKVKPQPDWEIARQRMQLALMPIPEAAKYVKGEYVVELAPADGLVADSLRSLTKDSGLIVVARMREGKSFLTKDGMSISTSYEADVSEVIKGPAGGPKPVTPWTIKIILPGGRIQLGGGRVAEVRIRNRKPVEKGENYVFFLQRVEQVWPESLIDQDVQSGYVPKLGWQGLFQLTGHGIKPRGHEISPVPKEFAKTPNKEFIQLVRNAASN